MGRGGPYSLYHFLDMETTVSTFSVTFDGRTVVRAGEYLLDTLPEHAFPVQFGTSATSIINSPFPRLDAFGNLSMSFSITTVRKFSSPAEVWRAFFRWLENWKTAGKGTFAWSDEMGAHEQRFEAIITEAEPKIQGLYFIVSYNFTLGKPL